MDMQGNPIESDLLPYDLTGDGTLGPTDLDHLFLAGEALIGTDGPSLRECLTGRVYPIETDGAFADLLQAVEAQRDTAETPLLVSLNARIYGPGDDSVIAFTPFGIENLQELIEMDAEHAR